MKTGLLGLEGDVGWLADTAATAFSAAAVVLAALCPDPPLHTNTALSGASDTHKCSMPIRARVCIDYTCHTTIKVNFSIECCCC